MPSQTPQERFVKCWSEAMYGYANATCAAYWEMTNQTLSAWNEAARAMSSPPSRSSASAESWFQPDRPARSALLASEPHSRGSRSFPRHESAGPFAAGASAMPAPLSVWFNMFPLRGSPLAWPMAYAMLSSGVPKNVAWPAAEANAAMMGAAEAAREALDQFMQDNRAEEGTIRRRQTPNAAWLLPFAVWPVALNWPAASWPVS